MSRNPYVQVALTYLRRPFASGLGRLACLLFCVVAIPSLFLLTHAGKDNSDFVFPQLTPLLFLFFYFALHVKGQFADSRARLTPDFRRVHITVAIGAAILFAFLLPALFTWLAGWHSIGFIAVAVAWFGVIVWASVQGWSLIGFAVTGVWVAVIVSPWGQQILPQLVSGQFDHEAVALLAFGILISLAAGVRLARMTEDTPGYQSLTQWNEWSQRRPIAIGQKRVLPWLSDWVTERQMAILTRHAARASHSRWSQICRWRVAMPFGWSLWSWILWVLVLSHALTWLFWMEFPERFPNQPLGPIPFMLTFMPALATIGVYIWRAPMFANELSRPVERTAYVRQMGAAGAVSLFSLWGGMAVALTLWGLLAFPIPLPPAKLAAVVAFSGAFQVVCFTVAVWSVRRRWLGAMGYGILFPVAQFMQMLGFMAPMDNHLAGRVLGFSVVAALLGMLLICVAYRRWLVADFD